MKIAWLILLVFAIAGCATKYNFAKFDIFKSEFVVKFDNQTARLFVNSNGEFVKFLLFSSLGASIASKILKQNHFEDDKFLMPDSRFETLFVCVLQNLDKNNFSCLVKNTNFRLNNVSK